MTRFKFTLRAAGPERFAPRCFDARIGDEVPVRLPDGGTAPGRLVAAEVAPDGTSVELTFEAEGSIGPASTDISNSFRREPPGER